MKIIRDILCACLVLCFTGSQAQTVDTLHIQSKIFNQDRNIVIVLPAGYHEYPSTEKKFNVAFIFDAQAGDFFDLYKSSINYLSAQGYLEPLILVGVASENRQFEFTAKARTTEGLKNFQKSGGADLLALHIKEELLPMIRNKYRCNPYTIGIGHSLGATFVSYCLLKSPGLFNAAIAISPNFQYDQEQMVQQFDSLATSGCLNHIFLYIAYGSSDYYEEKFKPSTKKIDSILETKNIQGLRWQVKSLDNDSHGTTPLETFKGLLAWNRQFVLWDNVIDSFYKDKNKSFIDHVKNYYRVASDWAGKQATTPDIINNMAYNAFYTDHQKDAIALFQWGIDTFPDNINLYDSMGEIQQRMGNKKEAQQYYAMGLELVKKRKLSFNNKTYENLVSGFEGRIKSLERE